MTDSFLERDQIINGSDLPLMVHAKYVDTIKAMNKQLIKCSADVWQNGIKKTKYFLVMLKDWHLGVNLYKRAYDDRAFNFQT
tara:strand:+ start:3678 stop:3923 length:246 start_codon:yes stop_codon:yes gene_type:complete